MADLVERTIGDLTIKIDRHICVGFGDCIAVAPEIFDLDAEGIVVFRDPLEDAPRDRLLEACAVCPVDALIVVDREGRQLVP